MAQSLNRAIRRGHVTIEQSKFVENADGSKRLLFFRRSKRGKKILIN